MTKFDGIVGTQDRPPSRLTEAATQLESERPVCAPWDQAEIVRTRFQEFFLSQREALEQALGNFSATLAHDVDTDLSHVADYAADELLSISEAYRSSPRESGE
jgi:hypothetical protein